MRSVAEVTLTITKIPTFSAIYDKSPDDVETRGVNRLIIACFDESQAKRYANDPQEEVLGPLRDKGWSRQRDISLEKIFLNGTGDLTPTEAYQHVLDGEAVLTFRESSQWVYQTMPHP